jgi:hypothetical protein
MELESQSEDSSFAEYVENARWRFGGFVFATIHMVGSGNVFATIHMVGSGNVLEPFPGRSSADDQEVADRTEAALVWLEQAFEIARSNDLIGVVLAVHGNSGLERDPAAWPGFEEFVDRLEELVKGFEGSVLFIHGDSHIQRVDHPLRDLETGEVLPNFTRLETYGSPDIGWVRVVVDSVAGRFVEFEPRLMPRWWLW